MLSRSLRLSVLAFTTLVAACTTAVPPAQVTRFHLNQPFARGAITLRPLDAAKADTLEFRSQAAAVSGELTRLGFNVVPVLDKAEQIATIDVARGVRPSALPARSPVTIGIGGGSFGGNVGIGIGTSFGVGKKRSNDVAVTTLSVQIKRASDESVVWEGRAQGKSDSAVSPDDEVRRLASALFRDFPGPSGKTVEVK